MNTIKEQERTGSGLDAEAGDYTPQLLVNVRKDFQVRFSAGALAAAVRAELFCEVLSALEDGESGINVGAALASLGLAPAAGAGFGLTAFGEGALVDRQGGHAFNYVEREYAASGLDAALRRVAGFRAGYFDLALIEERAAVLAQGVLDAAEAAGNYGAHVRFLREAAGAVGGLASEAEGLVSELRQSKDEAERRLEAARSARRPARQPAREGKVRTLYNRAVKAAASIGQENPDAFLERELLTQNLRLLTVEFEKSVFDEVVTLLAGEAGVDETSAAVLEAARREAHEEARRAERTRDYGMAGGELLLNGKGLTDTTISQLWGGDGRRGLVSRVRAEYAARHGGEDLMSATGGELTPEALGELRAIVDDEAAARLRGFTVVDALVALRRHGTLDIQASLEAAFKEAASTRTLLAPYYGRALDLQCFAALTFAKSETPSTNAAFDRMIDGVKDALAIEVEVMRDTLDLGVLQFFCEFFCVPVEALELYAESYDEFEAVSEEPRYCPHPEIYTS
jgi:hypothetical protein